jgi:DNA helicase-2/ATP-dependent DNA helicase PcrA
VSRGFGGNTGLQKNSTATNIGFGGKPGNTSGISVSAGSSNSSSFSVGDLVEHKKFGRGTISKITPDSGDHVIEIQFEGTGMKRLMASMANLKKN